MQKRTKRKPNPRRAELVSLSNQVKLMRNSEDPALDNIIGDLTINNMIMQLFYPAGEYKTFKGWKDDGFIVQKDQKGYPIWGRKRKMKAAKKETTDEEKTYSTFPVAYLFNENQVAAI